MQRDPADPHNLATGEQELLQTILIATEGMRNTHAVKTIEDALRNHPGVKEVRADLESALVKVTFDSRKTHAPDLHDAIGKAGYHASRHPDADLTVSGGGEEL